jgi:hypothetical protein
MLYARVPADFKPYLNPRLFDISEREGEPSPHPLAAHYCPACDQPLAAYGQIVLVPVGIAPEDRKDGGWANAGCVAVHLACSGYTEEGIAELAQAQDNA